MNKDIKHKIENLASEFFKQVVDIRHHIHQNPELSFQEHQTSSYIKSILEKENISYSDGWAGTGIVAHIKGTDSSKCIALRADIDALPIQEKNEVAYASKNQGIMHACGHDVHTSSLLGTILILSKLRADLPHNVICIFQPGEEKLPGGASILINEGIFEKYRPDFIIGQHVHPPLNVGQVGIKAGMYMASADEIYITIKGKGGHAATPNNCIDPILIASNVILNLQTLVSRKADPTTPSVLTIGKINSIGGATNIIPDEVMLEGTFRTMDEDWRAQAHELILQIVENTAIALGGTAEIDIKKGYPFLMNNEPLTEVVKSEMIRYLGNAGVVDLPIRMTAEDFAYYSQQIPGCFYRLGTGNDKKRSPVHTPTYDIDENALKIGMGLMAYLAFSVKF